MGNFNNSSYVVVTAAASDIAKKYHDKNLVGYFLLSLTLFSALLKYLNCTYWIKWTHMKRFYITNVLFIVGYALMSYDYTIDGDN